MFLTKMSPSLPTLGNMEKYWRETMFREQYFLVCPAARLTDRQRDMDSMVEDLKHNESNTTKTRRNERG